MANTQKHINYSYADIEKYLQGKMNTREMHEFEKIALTDSFLAEAIDGYKEINATEAANNLQQIETAILSYQEKTKVVTMPAVPKRNYWRVAASVIVLIGIGGITFLFLNKQPAKNSIVKTEINNPQQPAINNNNQATVTPPTATNNENEKNTVAQNTSPKNTQAKKEPIVASAENTHTTPSALKDDKHIERKENAAIIKTDSLQTTITNKEDISTPQTLSETVATSVMQKANTESYSFQNKNELIPEDGWDNYKNYLRKILSENFKPNEFKGTIELAILINNSGKVQEVSINKSPNQKINNTIIKAVKEGGNWLDHSPSKEKKAKKIVSFTLQ
ncbi:MAG: hypothetical protein JSR09_11165 [Bacteroidetes bacterium]|nr:hypothetical protein [Bacteroidota bacterium]MBS1650251.1 hypothetical protein [Bacteroidota bacterium]